MSGHLKTEINKLTRLLWQKRKLTFTAEEFANAPMLEEERILSFENDHYVISNYEAVAKDFWNHYKEAEGFEYSMNFTETFQFLKRFNHQLPNDHTNLRAYYLEEEILKIVILETHKDLAYDFQSYISHLQKNQVDEDTFEFANAYGDVMDQLNISEALFYENGLQLHKLIRGEDNSYLNSINLANGFRRKSAADDKAGLRLLNIGLQNELPDSYFIDSIITGLYDSAGYFVFEKEILPLLTKPEHRLAMTHGLANIKVIKENEVKLFISLFDEDHTNDNLSPATIRLLVAIIKSDSDYPDKRRHINETYRRLETTIKNADKSIVFHLINDITFLRKDADERTRILVSAIHRTDFSLRGFKDLIRQFFHYIKDISKLKDALIAIAMRSTIKEIQSDFDLKFTQFKKPEMDLMLIDLITDDTAAIRFTGLKLSDEQASKNGYEFDIDLTALPSITQYKLWMAVTQNFKEPKEIVPTLLPLFQSKSGIVREALTCKFEEYIENYGAQVILALEASPLSKVPEIKKTIERLKLYLKEFENKYLKPKSGLKELDPRYTHYKSWSTFQKIYHKEIQQKIQSHVEAQHQKGFLKDVKTIVVAKGGGWRHKASEKIRNLSTYESSISLPRAYFIFPNNYEQSESQRLNANWTDEDFNEIKNALDHE